ncbi:MAG TPA: hypothetical protein VKF83_02445 [Stellaceae bacterium]|nr:hypothetical protein [Stellaceae bacterium]
MGEERLAICGTGAADDQFDEPATQGGGHRHPCGFAALGLAADLHDDALAFVQPLAARENLGMRQEGGPVVADIDEHRTERRQEPHDAAEMNAAGLAAVAAFDEKLEGNALFEQRSPPLARAGRYQQLAIQLGR